MENQNQKGLSFVQLMGVIIGSTIGSGIFTTAADMAAGGAHTGAVLIGWCIAGVGMLALMMCFFGLNQIRPDLTNGVYSYAGEGFGSFVGFNSAWGYWISALLCNVSYMTLLFAAIGYFFPVFGEGNNLISIICASVILWLLNALVLRGVESAAFLNIITTISKLVPLFVFVLAIIVVRAFDWNIFVENFWGDGSISVLDQVKGTTGATVWSFIGIEGAVVLSGRAKKSSDVGRASVTAFGGLLAIYVLIAVLCFGTTRVEDMAAMGNPQLASILENAVGPWGAALINIGVILSLAGALLSWTIIASDCPYSAATQGVFSKFFAGSNEKGAPRNALYITNGVIQLFLIILYFNDSTYQVFYNLSANMIMVPYLLSAAFYLKIAITGKGFEGLSSGKKTAALIWGLLGTVYGCWMLYSAGLSYLLVSSILYAIGIIIFVKGKKEKQEQNFDNKFEVGLAIVLIALAILSVVLIARGIVDPF